MNVEEISIESDEHGFELHILTTDEGRMIFNIHGIAEELYVQVCQKILPWIAEGVVARREFESGVADDPGEQAVLDRIRGGKDPADVPWAERDPEMVREMADNVRKAMRENP